MTRKRNQKALEESVKFAIKILERVQDGFGIQSKFLLSHSIHRRKNTTYFRVLERIISHLEELRGSYTNPLRYILEDYFTCVCERFMSFNRQPTTANFSPSPSNKIEFLEWIIEFEREHGESYWVSYKIKPEIEFTNI